MVAPIYDDDGTRITLPDDFWQYTISYRPAHTECDDPECEIDHDEMDELRALLESPDAESERQTHRQAVYTGITSRRVILPILGCSSLESEEFIALRTEAMHELYRIGYLNDVLVGPRNLEWYLKAFEKYSKHFTDYLFRDGYRYGLCNSLREQGDCVEFMKVKALNAYFEFIGDDFECEGEAEEDDISMDDGDADGGQEFDDEDEGEDEDEENDDDDEEE